MRSHYTRKYLTFTSKIFTSKIKDQQQIDIECRELTCLWLECSRSGTRSTKTFQISTCTRNKGQNSIPDVRCERAAQKEAKILSRHHLVLPVRIFRGPIGQIHELFRDACSCCEETKMTKLKKRNRKIKYEKFHRTLMKLIEDPDDDVPIFAARHQQLQASDSLREVEDDPDDDVPLFAARQ